MFEKKLFLVCVIVLLSYVTGYIPASAEDAGEETNGWVAKADLPEARFAAATAVVNGKIYVIGGSENNRDATKSVIVYDPKTDTWDTSSEMPKALNPVSATAIDQKIYVLSRGFLVCYDTIAREWKERKSIPINATNSSTAVIDGKIYLIGGVSSPGYSAAGLHNSIYEYNPVTDTWSKKHDLMTDLADASATVLNGKIYILGGHIPGNKLTAMTQIYNPADDSIKEGKPLNTARHYASAVTIGSDMYIIGGSENINNGLKSIKTVEMYTPEDSTPDTETPETPTTPEPTPDQSSGDRALLVITMTNGLEKEFDLSMDEVNDFISWYDQKDAGSGSSKYAIDKHDNNKGPFSSRKDYVIFNNILTFEVNEYSSK